MKAQEINRDFYDCRSGLFVWMFLMILRVMRMVFLWQFCNRKLLGCSRFLTKLSCSKNVSILFCRQIHHCLLVLFLQWSTVFLNYSKVWNIQQNLFSRTVPILLENKVCSSRLQSRLSLRVIFCVSAENKYKKINLFL